MREVALDTETTGKNDEGSDPSRGHRLVEIGAVEMKNGVRTGRTYQQYINPAMKIDPGASKVHGITNEHVRECPKFRQVAGDFLEFIGDAKLVIHNAPFDLAFLNRELSEAGYGTLPNEIVDTLPMARAKHPGERASLDALQQKYKVQADRSFHGALIDAVILADVYYGMIGPNFAFDLDDSAETEARAEAEPDTPDRVERSHVPDRGIGGATPEEAERHSAFAQKIGATLWGVSS